jgi:hypothetical protein
LGHVSSGITGMVQHQGSGARLGKCKRWNSVMGKVKYGWGKTAPWDGGLW